ncbi:MAG: SpoIIE family protein phosphatase [Leptospiraceae bacterium]|nr:SpoIIE family protein phosphatase [Leptospiraceae bacterium]
MKGLWHKILPHIAPGIRAKLTIFTLFFVTALIIAGFVFSYFSQKSDLEASFRKEVRAPEETVSAHVADLHRFTQGLIQLETFRIRLKEKTAAARAYQKVVQVREESLANAWRSFISTFGARVQYSYQTRRYDTYYSTYLTQKNLQVFENQLFSAIAVALGRPPEPALLKRWQNLAAKVAAAEMAAAALEEKNTNRQNEREISRHRNQARDYRALLMGDLGRTFDGNLQTQLDRMQFERQTIRILSYGTELEHLPHDTGKKTAALKLPHPLLDTGLRGVADSPENWALLRSPDFSNYVHRVFAAPEKYFYTAAEPQGQEIRLAQQWLEVRFVPVPIQVAVVERARRIRQMAPTLPAEFVETEKRFCEELKTIAEKKTARFEALRSKGIPPFKDAEYMALSRDYRGIVARRDAALRKLLNFSELEKQHFAARAEKLKAAEKHLSTIEKKIKELQSLLRLVAQGKAPPETPSPAELENQIELSRQQAEAERARIARLKLELQSYLPAVDDSGEDVIRLEKLLLAESLLYLREAALFGRIRLAFTAEQDVLRTERRDAKARNEKLQHFAAVREFIYSARTETEIPVARGATSPLAGGVLAMTRSEAEQLMHAYDTRPLVGEDSLAQLLLNENIAGYNFVVIDKTAGLERIWQSTRRLLYYSSAIAVLAIVAAWYFSGLAVRRIQALSATAAQVREGNLQVVFEYRGYDELSHLGQSLNSMVEGLREREELRGELLAAEEIQKRLLPAALPKNLSGRADLAGFYKAMVGIGGDYFDYIALGNDFVALAMGDVSNHGVGPALVMAITRSQLHAELRTKKEISLKNILLKLNEQLYAETPANIFVTFFLALYNLKTGELQYISAGHTRPLLYRRSKGGTRFLEAGGMPLGMDDNDFFATTLSQQALQLAPGDIFFQYTDGLSEAMDSNRAQFGYDRIGEEVARHALLPAAGILDGLVEALEKFTGAQLKQPGPSSLSDDIAMVCLKRLL